MLVVVIMVTDSFRHFSRRYQSIQRWAPGRRSCWKLLSSEIRRLARHRSWISMWTNDSPISTRPPSVLISWQRKSLLMIALWRCRWVSAIFSFLQTSTKHICTFDRRSGTRLVKNVSSRLAWRFIVALTAVFLCSTRRLPTHLKIWIRGATSFWFRRVRAIPSTSLLSYWATKLIWRIEL